MQNNFERYSCQMALPGFSESAQQKLKDAKVLVIGAGGLGCPVLQYLVASGVGTIGIADGDTVSVSNLHRQILYGPADVGKSKVSVAAEKLRAQNPDVAIQEFGYLIAPDNSIELTDKYDVIVDCTDNFEARYLINDTCVIGKKPLVYAAIYQYEGQLAVWNLPAYGGLYSPNYRDLYPDVNTSQVPNCSVGGVIPTLAGIMGSMQANEVIKYITGTGDLLTGRILIFDAASMQSRVIKIGDVTKTSITQLPQNAALPLISFDEYKQLSSKKQTTLIDVRTLAERDLEDIGGLHIPLDELEEGLPNLNQDNLLVFYCATGKRSGEAVKLLTKHYPNIDARSLAGGLQGM
ncbi:thiamine biosynthesis protein [Mucilaginibacter pallidiroseus]|uniref:Molybdopterin-synthase adenylyltransferase n=1 Tax=Mucilaginibacter pallidiroseus TaxID=2599295 RepID=A0A563UJ95_9SPHI|nr:HesA/MoeB/ThiF family protein [Mucilaginibacter pallidiroseus]TWR31442.1 thiamine biosynthesis protein [Mucilaginibacter pallidiroseus]